MHKNRTAIILIMLAFSAATAEASYQKFNCDGSSPVDTAHDFTCGGASNPTIWCNYDDKKLVFSTNDCAPKCAKACGQLTRCLSTAMVTCEACCNAATSGCEGKSYPLYSWTYCFFPTNLLGREACACRQACIGTCGVNTQFCDIIHLLEIVVGIAAAVIISIHGVMWAKSEDAHGRDDAKKGIWYVIVGLIVIATAGAIVSFLLNRPLYC
jgi:hypothetical protein